MGFCGGFEGGWGARGIGRCGYVRVWGGGVTRWLSRRRGVYVPRASSGSVSSGRSFSAVRRRNFFFLPLWKETRIVTGQSSKRCKYSNTLRFNKAYASQPHVFAAIWVKRGFGINVASPQRANAMARRASRVCETHIRTWSQLKRAGTGRETAAAAGPSSSSHFLGLLENCMNSHQFSSRPKTPSPAASRRCSTTLTAFSPHVAVQHASERKTLASMVRAMVLRPFMGRRAIVPINESDRSDRNGSASWLVPCNFWLEEFFVGARHPILRNCRNSTKTL